MPEVLTSHQEVFQGANKDLEVARAVEARLDDPDVRADEESRRMLQVSLQQAIRLLSRHTEHLEIRERFAEILRTADTTTITTLFLQEHGFAPDASPDILARAERLARACAFFRLVCPGHSDYRDLQQRLAVELRPAWPADLLNLPSQPAAKIEPALLQTRHYAFMGRVLHFVGLEMEIIRAHIATSTRTLTRDDLLEDENIQARLQGLPNKRLSKDYGHQKVVYTRIKAINNLARCLFGRPLFELPTSGPSTLSEDVEQLDLIGGSSRTTLREPRVAVYWQETEQVLLGAYQALFLLTLAGFSQEKGGITGRHLGTNYLLLTAFREAYVNDIRELGPNLTAEAINGIFRKTVGLGRIVLSSEGNTASRTYWLDPRMRSDLTFIIAGLAGDDPAFDLQLPAGVSQGELRLRYREEKGLVRLVTPTELGVVALESSGSVIGLSQATVDRGITVSVYTADTTAGSLGRSPDAAEDILIQPVGLQGPLLDNLGIPDSIHVEREPGSVSNDFTEPAESLEDLGETVVVAPEAAGYGEVQVAAGYYDEDLQESESETFTEEEYFDFVITTYLVKGGRYTIDDLLAQECRRYGLTEGSDLAEDFRRDWRPVLYRLLNYCQHSGDVVFARYGCRFRVDNDFGGRYIELISGSPAESAVWVEQVFYLRLLLEGQSEFEGSKFPLTSEEQRIVQELFSRERMRITAGEVKAELGVTQSREKAVELLQGLSRKLNPNLFEFQEERGRKPNFIITIPPNQRRFVHAALAEAKAEQVE